MKKFTEDCIIPETNGNVYDLKLELDSMQGKVYSLITKILGERAELKKGNRKLEQEIERLKGAIRTHKSTIEANGKRSWVDSELYKAALDTDKKDGGE